MTAKDRGYEKGRAGRQQNVSELDKKKISMQGNGHITRWMATSTTPNGLITRLLELLHEITFGNWVVFVFNTFMSGFDVNQL